MKKQRLERLENEVTTLSAAGQERILKKMQQMFAAMDARLDVLSSNKSHESPRSSSRNNEARKNNNDGSSLEGSSSNAYMPKFVKLDFPRFNRSDDPTEWICRAEQFFEFHKTPKEDRVPLASFNLEHNAQLWFQLIKNEMQPVGWVEFKQGLLDRYGPTQYQDFFGDLIKLQQTGSVQDYQTQFEKLLVRADKLSSGQQVNCFVSGLKESIRVDVQASKPKSLSAAIGLARLYEARNISAKRGSQTEIRKVSSTPPSIQQDNPMPIIKLTPIELRESREKGLCFNCNKKFGPGHRCKKLFLIEGNWPDDNADDVDMEVEEDQHTEVPEVSFNAIYGARTPQTMKIRGLLAQHQITVLVDSGSTHNFLDAKVASKLGIKPGIKEKFDVAVANGEKISCMKSCNGVQLKVQGNLITDDFYIISLVGCDVVLGALGPIRSLGLLSLIDAV